MQVTREQLGAWVEGEQGYAIFALDSSGRVTSWNAGAERILGYQASEILGQSATRLFTPEDQARGAVEYEIGQALSQGHGIDDRWHVRKDGLRIWVSGLLTPLRDGNGALRGFVKIMRDKTEQRRQDEQLRRRVEELEGADRRKTEFLATLSHELRNPLAPILNSVYVLHQHFPSEDSIIQQARGTIERQVMHLKRLVDDLLDVSRVAANKVQLRKEPVDLGQVATRAAEDVVPLIAERRHHLTVTLAPEPISVAADPTRLAQIIVNLLTNAAKYTDPGGCIWLTTRREDGQAVLRIRDTGIGIASEMLPRVFDLFAQADVSPDRAQGGLGIGLALVRSLVEMHGGTIRATSPGLGQGSEFTVRLPALSRSADRATGPEGTTKPKLPPRRVLLVEDNADTARTLGLVLRRAGHDVLVAHDGPAAIEMARNQQPDVVLLDIGLPGMSGYEVARTIRDELNVPLIAMTGYAKEEGAGVQFDHYLLKPVSPDALLKLLADPRRA